MQGWISDKRWGAYIDETGSLTTPTQAPAEFKEPKAFNNVEELYDYWGGGVNPNFKPNNQNYANS